MKIVVCTLVLFISYSALAAGGGVVIVDTRAEKAVYWRPFAKVNFDLPIKRP